LLALGAPRAQVPALPFVNRGGAPTGITALLATWEQPGGGGTELEPGAKAALDAAASANGAPYALVFRAVREYVALRENGEAQALLHFARERVCRAGEGPYLLSVAFALAGDNLASINAANRAFEHLRDARVNDPQGLTLRRRFPILYRDLVFTTAQRHSLDPYLVLGVIKQESGFQLEATSSAGARGLMQVMPGTGRTIARKRGLRGFHTAQLYKPETSLDFGCWFLADLLRKLGGEIPAALAGYNAGLGRPQQWWPRFACRDNDALVELIPFDETEGYVKAILRNYEMYQRLYRPATNPATPRENLFDRLARPASTLP
jgi:soluble lytic murein transglycosylase